MEFWCYLNWVRGTPWLSLEWLLWGPNLWGCRDQVTQKNHLLVESQTFFEVIVLEPLGWDSSWYVDYSWNLPVFIWFPYISVPDLNKYIYIYTIYLNCWKTYSIAAAPAVAVLCGSGCSWFGASERSENFLSRSNESRVAVPNFWKNKLERLKQCIYLV